MTETTSTVGTAYIGNHNTFFVSPKSTTYKGRDYSIYFTLTSTLHSDGTVDDLSICVMLNNGLQPRYPRTLKELKDLVDHKEFDDFGTPPDMKFISKTLDSLYRDNCRIDKVTPDENVLKMLKLEGDVI